MTRQSFFSLGMSSALRFLSGVFLCLVCQSGWPSALTASQIVGHQNIVSNETGAESGVVVLRTARLESASGTAQVSLPHVLQPADFRPEGSTVRYTLEVDQPILPIEPIGIYIRKVSLAGQLYLNGEWIGACSVGNLDVLRCLHRPWLLSPPNALWKQGKNQFTIEVHADARQMNGLSTIEVGPLLTLERGDYSSQRLMRVLLMQALSWITVIVGVLSLMVALYLPDRSLYLWLGLASLMHALSNINFLSSVAWPSPDTFSWFAFSSRMASTPLLLLACIAYYEKDKPWQHGLALAYAVLGPVIVWLSDNNRMLVSLYYVPLLVCGVLTLGAMGLWSWRSRRLPHSLMMLAALAMLLAGYGDWQRLRGESAFEGVYLMAYASAGFLVIMGSLVMAELAAGLIKSRELAAVLEKQVSEREELLQDMHDGFGSQLTSARLLVEQGALDQRQIKDLLAECMSDLYLVVDTLSGHGKTLDLALGDFRFRTDRRTSGLSVQMHWDQRLDHLPTLSDRDILQILRILQEAVTNALKHAQAANIWIDVIYLSDQKILRVSVVDDGVGIPEKPRQGRGVRNMKQRVREIGGTLRWTARMPGTQVMMELPVPQA